MPATRLGRVDNDRAVRSISMAHGPRYHRFVLGLARSWHAHVPTPLEVHSDAHLSLPARVHMLDREALNDWKVKESYWRAKNLHLIGTVADSMHQDEMLTWVDADALILEDPTPHISSGKINVISHGVKNRRIRACGNGVFVPQSDYAIGCFWSMPAKFARRLRDMAVERNSWQDKGGHCVHQNLLNILIRENGAQYLDRISPDKVYNMPHGHLVPSNPEIRRFRVHDGILYMDDKIVAQLHMPSVALQQNMDSRWSAWQPAKWMRAWWK